MIVYLIPVVILLISSIFYDFLGARKNKIYMCIYIFMYIYMCIVIGLRFNVGGDSYFYFQYFQSIERYDLFGEINEYVYQPLFELLLRVTKTINTSFILFQIFHVIIINTVLFWFIYKNTENIIFGLFLCVLAFYINFSVEILRESLAVMCFLMSYKHIKNKSWFKYYIYVAAAISFHLSAIILLFLPLVSRIRLNKKFLLFLLIYMLFMIRSSDISVFLGPFEDVYEKITFYSSVTYSWNTHILFLTVKGLLPLLILYLAKFYKIEILQNEGVLAFAILLGFAVVFNPIIFSRFYNYFLPILCISLSDTLVVMYRKSKDIFSKLIPLTLTLILMLGLSIYSFLWPVDYYKKWIPYESILNDNYDEEGYFER